MRIELYSLQAGEMFSLPPVLFSATKKPDPQENISRESGSL